MTYDKTVAESLEKQRFRKRDRLPEYSRKCCICSETDPLKLEVHHLGKSLFKRFGWHNTFVITVCRSCHSVLTAKQQWRAKHARPEASILEHAACAAFDAVDLLQLAKFADNAWIVCVCKDLGEAFLAASHRNWPSRDTMRHLAPRLIRARKLARLAVPGLLTVPFIVRTEGIRTLLTWLIRPKRELDLGTRATAEPQMPGSCK